MPRPRSASLYLPLYAPIGPRRPMFVFRPDDFEAQLAAIYDDDAPASVDLTAGNPAEPVVPEPVTPEPVIVTPAAPAVADPITPEPVTPAPEPKGKGDLHTALTKEREQTRLLREQLAQRDQELNQFQSIFNEPDPEPDQFQQVVDTRLQSALTPVEQRMLSMQRTTDLRFARFEHKDYDDVTGLATISEDFPQGDPTHPVVAALRADPIAQQRLAASDNQADALYRFAKTVHAMRPEIVEKTIQDRVNAEVEARLKQVMPKFQAGAPLDSLATMQGAPTVDTGLNADNLHTSDAVDAAIDALYRED